MTKSNDSRHSRLVAYRHQVHHLAHAVRSYFTVSTKLELVSRILTVLVALCAVVIAIIVTIEIVGLLSQGIMAALRAKQDVALDILRNSFDAMDKLGAAGAGEGIAPTGNDLVVAYENTLGPHYDDEQATFASYIDSIDSRRYIKLTGMTKSLFPNASSVRSAMGGVDYGPDWWKQARSHVDIEGNIMFSGNSVDKTLFARNYSDLVDFLGLDPSNPVLTSTMIDMLLPRLAIPKRVQLAEFKYKLYSTDPEKLDSFNVHIATDDWLKNLGGNDVKTTATCRLLEQPTITKFVHIFGAFWCPRKFAPSASYASRFVNASVGNWVIECDSNKDMDLTLEIIRWNGKMPERYSTAFYHNTIKIVAPRKTFYTQTMLANLTGYASGNGYPVRDIVAVASSGTLVPQPSTIYIVQTQPIPDRLRTAILGLALLCVLFTRCTLVGVRTLCHFILESSLSILLDVVYAVLTYPSGTELATMIATARSAAGLNAIVHLAILLRRFSTPALIMAKTVLSMPYGFRQVTPCITIKEAVVMIVIQIVALYSSAGKIVGVGMHGMVTSDDMSSYVWRFHGIIWLTTIVFVFVRFQTGRVFEHYQKQPRPASVFDKYAGKMSRDSFTQVVSERIAYDEYLSGKFLSFGVCFLPLVEVKGRLCRVLDGSPLVLDSIFNFNLNGFGQYGRVQNMKTIAYVTAVGRYEPSEILLKNDYPEGTGDIVVG
ncbi:TPA: hypothetical protein N0F65_000741 [Lagenidium giganteum]|uniref:Uncharacterized protein n=1 Tax=Lagenidium giganteum TaxID=4803 RepID=A0AAV2ZC96_9STRA|nr:TPA: hypothetical protein N0F65_000741 [Lagenidium giganteum]